MLCGCVLLHIVTPNALAPSPYSCLNLCGGLLRWRHGWGGCDGMWSELGCGRPELLLLLGLLLLLLLLRHPLFVCRGPLRAAPLRCR